MELLRFGNLGGIGGPGGDELKPLFQAIGIASGKISVEPIRGSGSATFTNSSTGRMVRDFENIYRGVAANEARIQGARQVENLITQSGDPSHGDWTTVNVTVASGETDPDGGTTAYKLTATGAASWFQDPASVAGELIVNSIWIKRITGTGQINMHTGIGWTQIQSVVDGTWRRVSTSSTETNTTTAIGIQLVTSGDEVAIWHPQLEKLSGASNTAPGEYIATTTAAVAKYYTTTNGNSVSTFIVTEAAGVSLHPTVSKKGANVLARYADWAATEVDMEVGFSRLPTSGSGTAGGNGFWYQVSAITTGTTGGSEPIWPETIGNTVVDNGVTWTNKGHYKLAGYLGEPAGTNSILQSREFGTTWAPNGTQNLTQDQDGIDGVANTAWSFEDTDAAVISDIDQNVTISNDGNTHIASIYILKDTDTTRFPEFVLRFSGGTTQQINTQINTQTGAKNDRASIGTVSSSVEDHGLWWRLVLTVANNTTGNTTATISIFPAMTASIGSSQVAATGTVVIDQAQLELNTSVPSSPIVTTTVAVTRSQDILYYAVSGNVEDAAGTALINVDYISDDGASTPRALAVDAINSAYLYRNSGNVAAYDGGATDGPAISIGNRYQWASRWSGTVNQVQSNGASGSEGSYDGDYIHGQTIFYVGGRGASNSAWMRGIFSDLRIYNKDLGQTVCEDLTSYD